MSREGRACASRVPMLRDPEVERLSRKAARRRTGEAVADGDIGAVEEHLRRTGSRDGPGRLADDLNAIALRCAALPQLDDRSEDEILGYDEWGIPC